MVKDKSRMIVLVVLVLVTGIIVLGTGLKTLVGQATSTLAPHPSCARGDLNGDYHLDADDLKLWLSLMDEEEKQVTCCVDLDRNGIINQNDYTLFFDALLEEKGLGMCNE
jgi:hypothetical protein